VVDKKSGLRMVTDTRTNIFAVRKVREVTVTVTNITKDPIAVSSQSGCAVSAAAWAAPVPDGSGPAVVTRDPSTAKHWECAGGGSAQSLGSEEFILGPGASRKQTVRMTVGKGSWAVAGVCRCNVVSTSAPAGDGMTLGALQQLGITTQAPAGTSRLTTPPIAVRAT
jgi:hypothetical protein